MSQRSKGSRQAKDFARSQRIFAPLDAAVSGAFYQFIGLPDVKIRANVLASSKGAKRVGLAPGSLLLALDRCCS